MMNLYAKLRELEEMIKNNGPVMFKTPYKRVRKIVAIENGYIVYERGDGQRSKMDIDILYRDYFLLQGLGVLTSDDLRAFNAHYNNGKKPCDITTFMLLMEYFYGCEFQRGRRGTPSVITW